MVHKFLSLATLYLYCVSAIFCKHDFLVTKIYNQNFAVTIDGANECWRQGCRIWEIVRNKGYLQS